MRTGARIAAGAVVLLAGLSAAAGADAVDGLVAHWMFDEVGGAVAQDAVGSRDGAINGATSIADGFEGRALRFDGSDDVTVLGAAQLRAPDMVVSLWVRDPGGAPPAAGQVIIDNGDVLCGGSGYALVATASWAKVVFRDAQPNIGVTTIEPAASLQLPSLWDGVWHHVAIGAHGDTGGFVYLFIDGWHVATTTTGPVDTSDGIGYGTSPTDAFVVGDDDQDCGPGFVGDIDDVRVHDRLLEHAELAGLEPEIETTLVIDSVEPGAVVTDATINDWFDIDVTLEPAPAMPGSFWVYVTGEDGVERAIQRFDIGLGNLSADGHYDLAYVAQYGGSSTIRVAYAPLVRALPSEDSQSVQIAKAESFASVQAPGTAIATLPSQVAVSVHVTGRAPATGQVELWDVTGAPVLLGSAEVEPFPGQWNGGALVNVPGLAAGTHDIEARYLGNASHLPATSAAASLVVVADTDLPSATSPGHAFAAGSGVSNGAVPVRLSWTGTDATSGIGRFELRRSLDGGAFETVATDVRGTSIVRWLKPGHSYRFGIRPIDKAGNAGAWAYGTTFRISAAQDGSSRITYRGGWKLALSSAHWGGTSRYIGTAGATARISVTGRMFAWVASTGPARGTARIYVNGALVATVNLQTTTAYRRVVFSKTWSISATRTIEIRVSGTAGHPRVDVDALVWGR